MTDNKKILRILITGGGSGGHIFPLIAVAETLRDTVPKLGRELDLRYFGDGGDYEVLLAGKGIRVCHIIASKWRRYISIKNLFEPFRACIGFAQSVWRIFWFMPDVAFSKGGPGALVILLVCRWYRIPVIIHESDTVPGLTNAFTSRFARVIELGFKEAEPYFRAARGEKHVVGNPVRKEIVSGMPQAQAKVAFEFDPGKPVLFIVGGSQGAKHLNAFIAEHLAALLEQFQILHQVGADLFDAYKKEYDNVRKELSQSAQKNYRIAPFFLENMSTALAAADVVVSRAGANAIFEIAAAGKPAILIPITESTHNHQAENAYAYEKAGAGIVIEEENLLIGLFTDALRRILTGPGVAQKMAEAAKAFSTPDAAEKIADDIVRMGSKK